MYAIFIVVIIYLITPILGLVWFIRYRTAMRSSGVDTPPVIHFFFLYAYYGSIVIMLLEQIFWKTSGLSALGFSLALITSPVAIGLIIYDLKKKRQLSEYHALAYKLALLFFPAIGLMMAISIVIRVLM